MNIVWRQNNKKGLIKMLGDWYMPRCVRIKRKIWNAGILLFWYRLWIRKDEFHKSLEKDFKAMSVMDEGQRQAYINDLVIRRNRAHQETLTL